MRRLPKLAAGAVAPLHTKMNFDSPLLRRGLSWPQDVNHLRDYYDELRTLWDNQQTSDEELYQQTQPKLDELRLGLIDVLRKMPQRRDLLKSLWGASKETDIAEIYAEAQDFVGATTYQVHALRKIQIILDVLTQYASKNVRQFVSRLLKQGYGYDSSGSVEEVSNSHTNQKNFRDQDHGNDEGPFNADTHTENLVTDSAALRDFPELAPKPNRYPVRRD